MQTLFGDDVPFRHMWGGRRRWWWVGKRRAQRGWDAALKGGLILLFIVRWSVLGPLFCTSEAPSGSACSGGKELPSDTKHNHLRAESHSSPLSSGSSLLGRAGGRAGGEDSPLSRAKKPLLAVRSLQCVCISNPHDVSVTVQESFRVKFAHGISQSCVQRKRPRVCHSRCLCCVYVALQKTR